MSQFATYGEFKKAVHAWLSVDDWKNAGKLILQNRDIAPGYWIAWAERVKSGQAAPPPPPPPLGPAGKNYNLFGELITTGKLPRRNKRSNGNSDAHQQVRRQKD